MATIYHQVGIKATIDNVFNAIATIEGLSNWWTNTTGSNKVDGQLTFHFGKHTVNMEIIDLIDGQRVLWKNIDQQSEWQDTLFSFKLQVRDDEVMINFEHAEWKEVTELFRHCSTKWAVFLLSLKDYLETGKGRPFPEDIAINHSNS